MPSRAVFIRAPAAAVEANRIVGKRKIVKRKIVGKPERIVPSLLSDGAIGTTPYEKRGEVGVGEPAASARSVLSALSARSAQSALSVLSAFSAFRRQRRPRSP